MEQIYDLVILGSGPAGLGASIYAQRAELKTLVIEKEMVSGGQVLTTYEVDNYAGLPGINGFDLGMKFREHADRLGAEFAEDSIIGIQRAWAFPTVPPVTEPSLKRRQSPWWAAETWPSRTLFSWQGSVRRYI